MKAPGGGVPHHPGIGGPQEPTALPCLPGVGGRLTGDRGPPPPPGSIANIKRCVSAFSRSV